ncbi:phage tail spike protein [Gardnerella leopoldii]|uniref:phage tail spike protein n=1 Tax=Gardnerella leopoldii TaxID=2792978 RepID=UPI0039EFD35D
MRFAHVSYNGILKPDITSITKAVSTCAVDGTDTLDITTLDGGVEKNDRLLYLDGKGLWHEYIVQSVETQRDEGKPVTTAYCVNSIAELGSVYILDKRGRKTTAPERAKVALEGTRWNVGTVENGTIRHYIDLNFYHQSVLKSLQDITKAYGLEIETSISVVNGKITARALSLLEQRGNHNAERRFEYGCDLKSVKRTLMADQVITRLYAWGKGEEKTDEDGNTTGGYSRRIGIKEVNGGKPYLDDVEAQKYWGVLEGDAVFDDCTDRNELLRFAKARLAQVSKPQVAYEADVVNLGSAGFDAHGVSVGDAVQIVDTTFTPPIRVEGRVLKIEEDLLGSVDTTRITLGNISESYTQKRRAQEQKLDALIAQSSEWNAVAEGNGLYVRDLIGRLNEVLNARGGYTYFTPNAGLYVYDKNKDKNPTTVTQISGGFWRIADSKKPNGDWDWKNVCDGHGLFANRIYTGILSDAQGRNFWNLDTGEFSLQASAKIGGKTVQQIVNDSADGVISKMNESLTQEAIFNKLTNGGQTQGIYLNGGRVYLNASYLRTGVISGARGKWDLTQGIISMWDTAGNETVHLDGNGAKNKLVGEFRTSLPGNYGVVLSPNFSTVHTDDDGYKGKGSGVEFNSPGHYENPLVASEGESNDGSVLSSFWATSGRVRKHDPGSYFDMKEAYSNGKYARIALTAYGDYDDKDATLAAGFYATSYPNAYAGGGIAKLFSNNGRESCYMSASVSNGELYFNGALGEENNRNTFIAYHWLAMPHGMGARQHEVFEFTTGCPAKYGCYYAVASSDSDWGVVNCHVAFTGRAAAWKVGLENNLNGKCPVPVYANTFGWLVNRNMG